MNETSSFLWHTTPLLYVPYLLQTGALLSASQLSRENHPIRPRPSAIRRKTKLGLADFVHLSPMPQTPLLRDKQEKGYGHVLLSFDRAATLAIPGVALLKYNTKRWAHRDDFTPIRDADEQAAIWTEYESGKYPSLEILIRQKLPLTPYATGMHLVSSEDAKLLETLLATLTSSALPIYVSPTLFPLPSNISDDSALIRDYLIACQSANTALPPPLLPFD